MNVASLGDGACDGQTDNPDGDRQRHHSEHAEEHPSKSESQIKKCYRIKPAMLLLRIFSMQRESASGSAPLALARNPSSSMRKTSLGLYQTPRFDFSPQRTGPRATPPRPSHPCAGVANTF
jgi:hypothetical protein